MNVTLDCIRCIAIVKLTGHFLPPPLPQLLL